MPGGKPANVIQWNGRLRRGQIAWLRSHAGGGVTQGDIVRDAVDLVAAIVDGNTERVRDITTYIRARYGKDRDNE